MHGCSAAPSSHALRAGAAAKAPKSPAQPGGRRCRQARTAESRAWPWVLNSSLLPSAKPWLQLSSGPETLTGVETQDRTQGCSPLPKRVLPSFSHLRDWSDLIKVIFQELASGSQVTAQLAPERQTHALPFFAHLVSLRRK